MRTSGGISDARSQSGSKEAVEGVELLQKVLSVRRLSFSTWSIHEHHIILSKDPLMVNPYLHLQLVVQTKQGGKLTCGDLIFFSCQSSK
jgi:hypothetical protein